MRSILRVIADNVKGGTATVRLPGSVPVPEGFRGRVIIDPTRCLACGMCAYVCVSDAVTGSNEAKSYVWAYDPGRCTFCARCVDRCTGHALSMEPAPAPIYTKPGELRVEFAIALPLCPQCGAPSRPVTDDLLNLAFDHAVPDDTRVLVKLCERCRRRRLQRNLFAAAHEGKE
jgi:formate hydrogenlyase subunit 6/NADH:ubiquinone oxidoreductase subunit I